ncbi:hypothetical protein PTE30175_00921 [Pandoraea terrae]|uniref:Uncharacterized protein n=1 Tax=Pandoraea terrae TaxID=1537710 RepID=A0A5E4SQS1_9BURK|nr:hypothetical protein PTE30175_00921 [Pandoraea terrae]
MTLNTRGTTMRFEHYVLTPAYVMDSCGLANFRSGLQCGAMLKTPVLWR